MTDLIWTLPVIVGGSMFVGLRVLDSKARRSGIDRETAAKQVLAWLGPEQDLPEIWMAPANLALAKDNPTMLLEDLLAMPIWGLLGAQAQQVVDVIGQPEELPVGDGQARLFAAFQIDHASRSVLQDSILAYLNCSNHVLLANYGLFSAEDGGDDPEAFLAVTISACGALIQLSRAMGVFTPKESDAWSRLNMQKAKECFGSLDIYFASALKGASVLNKRIADQHLANQAMVDWAEQTSAKMDGLKANLERSRIVTGWSAHWGVYSAQSAAFLHAHGSALRRIWPTADLITVETVVSDVLHPGR